MAGTLFSVDFGLLDMAQIQVVGNRFNVSNEYPGISFKYKLVITHSG